MNILEMEQVSKRYGDFRLGEISLVLEKGFVTGLIGPNGAGKTTLLKTMLNLVRRDSGGVRVFGLPLETHEVRIKTRSAFVHETPCLYSEMTPAALDSTGTFFYGKAWDKEVFNTLLKRFDIRRDKKIKQLSKGTKVKCSVAFALSRRAELVILDEPLSGLDPVARNDILCLIQEEVEKREATFILSSHITSDLDKIADYVVFLNRGKILFSLPKTDLIERYRICKGGGDLLSAGDEALFLGVRRGAYGFTALTDKVDEVRSRFNDSMVYERPNLEDIMLFTLEKEWKEASDERIDL